MWCRDSSVSLVSRLQAGWSGVQIPAGARVFSLLQICLYQLWGPPSLICNGYCSWGMEVTTCLHLAPKLWIGRAAASGLLSCLCGMDRDNSVPPPPLSLLILNYHYYYSPSSFSFTSFCGFWLFQPSHSKPFNSTLAVSYIGKLFKIDFVFTFVVQVSLIYVNPTLAKMQFHFGVKAKGSWEWIFLWSPLEDTKDK